jgi:hypothetical protein
LILPLLFVACQSSDKGAPGHPDDSGPTTDDSGGPLHASAALDPYRSDVPCDVTPALPSDYFISPSDGAVLTTSPWIPVKLEFDDPKLDWTSIRTWIDCVETTDPMGVQRPIPLFLGDGDWRTAST